MNLALERYKEQIIVNEAFRQSLGHELVSNNRFEGTILLVANEILFEPNFVLDYHSNGTGIPHKCDFILVADSINMRGGSINLSGNSIIGFGVANKGSDGHDATEDIPAGGGGIGQQGNPGKKVGDGSNIKVFCKELVDIPIISNGGNGATGEKGGPGGNGGKGGDFRRNTDGTFEIIHRPMGQAGKGGRGGPGGPGGNAGMIEVFFCSVSDLGGRQDFVSNGGRGGDRGPGGEPGRGRPLPGHNNLETLRGEPGDPGRPGVTKPPVIRKVTTSELWEMASIELGIL